MSSHPDPQVIDNYTITKRIGAGAMGEVYLARESVTDRIVAIKLMGEHYVGDEQFIKRFEREISVVALLDHPHIATYAGHGTWKGQPYLAIEYIVGPTLADFLKDGGHLSEAEALMIAIQVAQGLDYAQQRCGLVHRDIKPGNVLIDLKGQNRITELAVAKIIDFGLAHARRVADFDEFGPGARQAEQAEKPVDGDRFQAIDLAQCSMLGGAVTMAGQIMGTPYYMSPEQISGEANLTFSSDLYSLGAMLFHLLTGRPPYEDANAAMIIVRHLNDPIPDPAALMPDLRPLTRQLVMRALAKKPAHRQPSYSQFIHQAQGALNTARGTGRFTRRVVNTAPIPAAPAEDPFDAFDQGSSRTLVAMDESARFIKDALDGKVPGKDSGSDALVAVTTRVVRRLQRLRENQKP